MYVLQVWREGVSFMCMYCVLCTVGSKVPTSKAAAEPSKIPTNPATQGAETPHSSENVLGKFRCERLPFSCLPGHSVELH